MATFRRATKEKAKLRLALIGLAGSGKTYSALAIGTSLVPGGRVALIDTERGSASLYADKFGFDTLDLETHSPLAYVDAIESAEREGYDVIVIDSLSHAWAGRDGALEQKDRASDRGGNSWTAWRDITPKHNKLVDTLISSRCHVIATLRSKMEYVQEKNPQTGKTEIRKVGLAAIQRDGLEYEFGIVGDMDLQHQLKISKSRCDVVDVGDLIEKPGESFARRVYGWLMSGAEPVARPAPAPIERVATAQLDDVFAAFIAGIQSATTQLELDKALTAPGRPAKGSPQAAQANEAYKARKAWLASQAAA